MSRDEFTRDIRWVLNSLYASGVSPEEIHDRTQIDRRMQEAFVEGTVPRDPHERKVLVKSLRRVLSDRIG